MKRRGNRDIAELSARQVKRWVNAAVLNPESIDRNAPSSISLNNATSSHDRAESSGRNFDQLGGPPVDPTDFIEDEIGLLEFLLDIDLTSINTSDAHSVCDPLFEKLVSDNNNIPNDYLMVCDSCIRCSMCSCFLECQVCNHSDTPGMCVHCNQCSQDWSSVTEEGELDLDSSDDSDGTDDGSEGESTFRDDLAQWAANPQYSLSHAAIKELLGVIDKHHPDDNLPRDPRTLLKTARSVDVTEVSPGYYWHHGIKKHIAKRVATSGEEEVKLSFSMDGLPIAKSSGSSLWPILCSMSGNHSEEVFVCGVYHGYSKPDSSNEYLREMTNEVTDLINNGLDVGGKHYCVTAHNFIFDAPAKAFVLYIKNHTGYFSCTRCHQKGKYVGNRMCFPEVDFVKRSDEDFMNQREFVDSGQSGHHGLEKPVILQIPGVKPVTQFVLDPMHLLYLGVMKKLLFFWTVGELKFRMGRSMFDEMSAMLIRFQEFIPNEFGKRKTRPLGDLRRYKATELRLLLDYVGPVAFRKLSAEIYENFLCLHFAVRLLSCPKTCILYNEYAAALMKTFVVNFKIIYGEQYVSHNIHGCLHINEDVLNYGYLDKFSAFKFENFMQKLKKMIRKGNKPLQQIAKRYSELEAVRDHEAKRKEPVVNRFLQEHNCGPLVSGCRYPQYKVFMCKGFMLHVGHKADCCVGLADGSVVEIKNFAYCADKKDVVLIGSKYLHKEDFFNSPCSSSAIGIYKVHGLSSLKCWSLKDISHKFVRLPLSNRGTFAVFPLLHTDACKF